MRIKREKLDEDSGSIADIPTPRSLGNHFGMLCDNLPFREQKFQTVIWSRPDTECQVWNIKNNYNISSPAIKHYDSKKKIFKSFTQNLNIALIQNPNLNIRFVLSLHLIDSKFHRAKSNIFIYYLFIILECGWEWEFLHNLFLYLFKIRPIKL